MQRAALMAVLPWLAILVTCVLVLGLVVRSWQARPHWRQLWRLHGDQTGAVQSLSFVLTLPIFIMVLMLIVQVSQLTIATIVVHYAAYAAARSASVWIPAATNNPDERANCISTLMPVGAAPGGQEYLVLPGSPKYQQIEQAAVLGCLSICPSRNTGLTGPPGDPTAASLQAAYLALNPAAAQNPQVMQRLANKLAYSRSQTAIQLTVLHKDGEPPLVPYYYLPFVYWKNNNWIEWDYEFHPNEIGWQDRLMVKVTHNFALLPGPGRLLAKPVSSTDATSQRIQQQGNLYVVPISATATLGNEGEKSVLRYDHELLAPI